MLAMPSFQISFFQLRSEFVLEHAFVAVERGGLAGLSSSVICERRSSTRASIVAFDFRKHPCGRSC